MSCPQSFDIYKEMTVPEAKPTPTVSNHCPRGPARKQLGAHLPAANCTSRLVDEPTLEEISRLNKQNNDMDTQRSDSKHTSRRSGKHT